MGDPCQRVLAAVRSDQPLADPELVAHARECPACSAVLALGPAPSADPPAGLDGMWSALEADLEREQAPVARLRSLRTPVRAALVTLAAVLVPALVLLTWRRVDASVYPGARMVLDAIAMGAPLAVLLVVVMRPLHRRAWPRWVVPLAVGSAVLGVLVGPMLEPAHQAHPASLGGTGPELVRRAVACLVTGTILGLPLVVATAVLLRRRGRAGLPPAVAVVLAGLVGSFAIFLHCPLVAPVHLLAGHAAVLGVYLVVAAVLARR